MEVVLQKLFLTDSNMNIQFAEKKLVQKIYTATEATPTTKKVELNNNKDFVTTVSDDSVEAFIIYVSSLNLEPIML